MKRGHYAPGEQGPSVLSLENGGGGGVLSQATIKTPGRGGKSRGGKRKGATPQPLDYDSSFHFADNAPITAVNLTSPIVMEPNDFSDQGDFEPQLFQTYQPEIGGFGGYGDGVGMTNSQFGGGKKQKSGVRKYKDEAPSAQIKSLDDLNEEFEKCNDLLDDFF